MNVIPDWRTNFLYFSELLPRKHPKLFKNLISILNRENIKYDFIYSTADIWCRDYMPIQINKNTLVQFIYNPKYLREKKYENLKTNPEKVFWKEKEEFTIRFSDLVIDGGNVICSEKAVILTDRIFEDNKHLKKENVLEKLSKVFQTENIYIVPKQPYDLYGHIDSMIRFINNDSILINDFSKESPSFISKFNRFLKNLPFDLVFLNIKAFHKYSWCYLNYIRIGNTILVPVTGHYGEHHVIEQLKKIFNGHEIYEIPSIPILRKGGGLHCITWNILCPN